MTEVELAYHTISWGNDDFVTALSAIGAVGYRGVEAPAGVVEQYEDRVVVFAEILAQQGVRLVAVTAGGRPLMQETQEEEIERAVNIARFLRQMGAATFVLYPPRRAAGEGETSRLELFIQVVNAIGPRTLELGVRTCVHPELGTVCEKAPEIARILAETSSECVWLCPDTAHLHYLRVNLPRFLREHVQRIGHVHLKDVKKRKTPQAKKRGGAPLPPTYCELGKGNVDLPRSVSALLGAGYSGWMTVELDSPSKNDPVTSARLSFEYAERSLDLIL